MEEEIDKEKQQPNGVDNEEVVLQAAAIQNVMAPSLATINSQHNPVNLFANMNFNGGQLNS